MVVCLCLCVFVFLCLTLFHFNTPVDIRQIIKYLTMVVCLCLCVFVFLRLTLFHVTISGYNKYPIFDDGCVFVFMYFCVFVFDLIHFTTSVDTINNSIFDHGCLSVFMCFCVFVFDLILHYISGYDKIIQYLTMVVWLCLCVFVFLCLTLFHFITSVDTTNN